MANFTAIAGVSTTVRTLLRDRMEQPVDLTIAPPDVMITGIAGRRLNLYLYQVSENGSLKNQEIPGQGHPADYGHPPLSLDLQYLLTAFGANEVNPDADLQAQQTLGDAMRVLHDFPLINDSLHLGGNPLNPLILDPSLVGEFERIKITLQPTGIEEFAKIWTALPQANFRRSVAYQVSVVQILSQQRRPTPLPVRERRVYAIPIRTPQIAGITRDPPFDAMPGAAAETGDTVLITGRNFVQDGTRVQVGETSIPIAAPSDSRISFVVPGTVPAGLHAVRVVRDLMLEVRSGQPPVAHRGFESNVTALLVIPQISGVAPASAGAGALVTVTVNPAVLARQRTTLILGDVEVPAEPMLPDAPPSVTVAFRLPTGIAAIPAGNYLMRLRVDGADSRLQFNNVTGLFTGPMYTVL